MPAVLSPVRSGTSEPADPSGSPAPPHADTPPVTPAPPGPPVCDDDEYDADGAGAPGGMFWSWPVDFEALDNQPVDLVFLLQAPEGAGADHLKALARIARLLRDQDVAKKLRASRDAQAIYSVLALPPASAA